MSCYPGLQPIAGCSFGPPIYRSDLLPDAFLGLRVPLISQRNDSKADCCSLSPEQRAAKPAPKYLGNVAVRCFQPKAA